jgi:hypothetical protein
MALIMLARLLFRKPAVQHDVKLPVGEPGQARKVMPVVKFEFQTDRSGNSLDVRQVNNWSQNFRIVLFLLL